MPLANRVVAPFQAPAAREELEGLSDEELVERARRSSDPARELEPLFRRLYPRVASWCLRFCGDRDRAHDLAQEVFLRAQTRLNSFRLECRFSTWLYKVTRSVAINGAIAAKRRRQTFGELADDLVAPDPAPDPEELLQRAELVARFKTALARDLEPMEAKVLYLHFVDGVSLSAVTYLLGLDNKSGAKAFAVSAKRKLHRRLGRWLRSQPRGEGRKRW